MNGNYALSVPVRKMTLEQFNSKITRQVIPHKAEILSFMKNAPVVACTSMPVYDKLTGEEVCSGNNAHSDGKYTWYESDIYHFEKYNLKLNDDFIEYVLNRPE